MTGRRILVSFNVDHASALSNALRREIEASGQRQRAGGTVGEEEYVRRLEGCLGSVTAAFRRDEPA